MHNKHTPLDLVALILLIVGAINWGLVGFLNMDLVAKFLGQGTMIAKIVYGLIAASGVYGLTWLFKKNS